VFHLFSFRANRFSLFYSAQKGLISKSPALRFWEDLRAIECKEGTRGRMRGTREGGRGWGFPPPTTFSSPPIRSLQTGFHTSPFSTAKKVSALRREHRRVRVCACAGALVCGGGKCAVVRRRGLRWWRGEASRVRGGVFGTPA
jgi:hypothetical protein